MSSLSATIPPADLVEGELLELPRASRRGPPPWSAWKCLVQELAAEEIDVELLHVDRQVRGDCAASSRTGIPRACAAATTSATGAIAPVTFETCPIETSFASREEVGQGLPPRHAIGVDRHRDGRRVVSPGEPVGVVLARWEDDLVLLFEDRARDEVDRLGGPADEDELVRPRPEQRRNLEPRGVVEAGRLFPERIEDRRAVNVGRALLVARWTTALRSPHARLRRRRCRVEIDERVAVDHPREERGNSGRIAALRGHRCARSRRRVLSRARARRHSLIPSHSSNDRSQVERKLAPRHPDLPLGSAAIAVAVRTFMVNSSRRGARGRPAPPPPPQGARASRPRGRRRTSTLAASRLVHFEHGHIIQMRRGRAIDQAAHVTIGPIRPEHRVLDTPSTY